MKASQSQGRITFSDELFTIEILGDKTNPLIGRRELDIRVVHHGRSTPSVAEVKRALARALKVSENLIYVRRIVTETGWGVSKARVHVYSDLKTAQEFEPVHIKKKNEGETAR